MDTRGVINDPIERLLHCPAWGLNNFTDHLAQILMDTTNPETGLKYDYFEAWCAALQEAVKYWNVGECHNLRWYMD